MPLRRTAVTFCVSVLVAGGASLLIAPAAEAKPKTPTTTCSVHTEIEFDIYGNSQERAVTICTTRFPSGTVQVWYDADSGTPESQCWQPRGSKVSTCGDL
jgi:hypothetical protein